MLAILAFIQLPALHQPDTAPVEDPMRPVKEITRNGFTLQYYTALPCQTRIEIRQDDLPMTAFGRTTPIQWKTAQADGPATTMHELKVSGLTPGKRYFYRIFKPGLGPTAEERAWGAGDGYDREFAVSTLASKGQKTIIHLPVKVLLMPNVINVISAYGEKTEPAPEPPAMGDGYLNRIKEEYAISSRFFWISSGMRLWVDYQIFVDDRWQRWGDEPSTATGFYKGLPMCRSYAGKEYTDPGGGGFTVLDTKAIDTTNDKPVIEASPYAGQIEQAFLRRWDTNNHTWQYVNSGGGTLGLDDWPKGIPGRSQFLGGGDTAWLATHEFHHQLESESNFGLSNREDDRIVFNHYAPRHRTIEKGKVDEQDWTTNGPHGEHWDGMAYWDRTLTDAQWLRTYFGTTEVVKDADGDGIPDSDPRLPLDEKRFGSDPRKFATDGEMNDLKKCMLSTWVPCPLQPTWLKTEFQSPIPDPKQRGWTPNPYPPFIVPLHAVIDGDAGEWSGVPLAGKLARPGGASLTFQQAHDAKAYYGIFTVSGPWKRIDAIFDGEGLGVYSGVGVQSFQVLNLASSGPAAAGPDVGAVDVKITPFKAPGLVWKATKQGSTTVFEFSLPNKGAGLWYWDRGGRVIGSEINVWDEQGRGFALGEPYHLFYDVMLEPHGQMP